MARETILNKGKHWTKLQRWTKSRKKWTNWTNIGQIGQHWKIGQNGMEKVEQKLISWTKIDMVDKNIKLDKIEKKKWTKLKIETIFEQFQPQ